jgi:EAL domain-containing protein (putative c-di-GMP-specific phosphodiesterase class I)
MYKAKENGRNNFQFYTQNLNKEAINSMELKNDLRNAIARNKLSLFYQPKVNIVSQEIVGAEALLRWHHPTRGMVPPAEFIPIAEQYGLIHEIGYWVIKEAIKQSKIWHESQFNSIIMSINLSAKQFQKRDFVDLIERELFKANMQPPSLELEITESLLMKEQLQAQEILKELSEKGHTISIDDFGTGYSSLSYLKRFTIDTLKIDQSFIKDITSVQDDTEIVKAIIDMAHALKLKVIAEGVENEEQLSSLRKLNCDEIQGFLKSKPIPPKAFERLLRQQHA